MSAGLTGAVSEGLATCHNTASDILGPVRFFKGVTAARCRRPRGASNLATAGLFHTTGIMIVDAQGG